MAPREDAHSSHSDFTRPRRPLGEARRDGEGGGKDASSLLERTQHISFHLLGWPQSFTENRGRESHQKNWDHLCICYSPPNPQYNNALSHRLYYAASMMFAMSVRLSLWRQVCLDETCITGRLRRREKKKKGRHDGASCPPLLAVTEGFFFVVNAEFDLAQLPRGLYA